MESRNGDHGQYLESNWSDYRSIHPAVITWQSRSRNGYQDGIHSGWNKFHKQGTNGRKYKIRVRKTWRISRGTGSSEYNSRKCVGHSTIGFRPGEAGYKRAGRNTTARASGNCSCICRRRCGKISVCISGYWAAINCRFSHLCSMGYQRAKSATKIESSAIAEYRPQ